MSHSSACAGFSCFLYTGQGEPEMAEQHASLYNVRSDQHMPRRVKKYTMTDRYHSHVQQSLCKTVPHFFWTDLWQPMSGKRALQFRLLLHFSWCSLQWYWVHWKPLVLLCECNIWWRWEGVGSCNHSGCVACQRQCCRQGKKVIKTGCLPFNEDPRPSTPNNYPSTIALMAHSWWDLTDWVMGSMGTVDPNKLCGQGLSCCAKKHAVHNQLQNERTWD